MPMLAGLGIPQKLVLGFKHNEISANLCADIVLENVRTSLLQAGKKVGKLVSSFGTFIFEEGSFPVSDYHRKPGGFQLCLAW